mgnify:FL=1
MNENELTNLQFRQNKNRDYPALILWPFNLFSIGIKENNIIIPFTEPTIGFRLSFPTRENVSAEKKNQLRENIDISYALNTVAQQQELIFDVDTDNESEDD